jgi:hypothetical protein
MIQQALKAAETLEKEGVKAEVDRAESHEASIMSPAPIISIKAKLIWATSSVSPPTVPPGTRGGSHRRPAGTTRPTARSRRDHLRSPVSNRRLLPQDARRIHAVRERHVEVVPNVFQVDEQVEDLPSVFDIALELELAIGSTILDLIKIVAERPQNLTMGGGAEVRSRGRQRPGAAG